MMVPTMMLNKKGFITSPGDLFKGLLIGLVIGIVLMLLMVYNVIPTGIQFCPVVG